MMSSIVQFRTPHIFSSVSTGTDSFFPRFAMAFVVILAASLSCVFVMFLSMSMCHNLLYDRDIVPSFSQTHKPIYIIACKLDIINISLKISNIRDFDWEQRKLSDLAEIVGGGTPDTNNSAYWDGDIDWYAPAEMEGQRYAKGSVRKITELGLQKSSAKILPAHRTVLFTSRAGIGKMAILQRSAATNQGFQSLVLKDGTDPYFIYSMGEKIKDMAEGVASGSTFLEISGKMLGNLEVMVPNLKEQKSIATFFRSIDDLITLHQCKRRVYMLNLLMS